MALPFALTHARPSKPADLANASHDPRALRILAKTIYRELRQGGLLEEDVMSVAGELLSLVTGEVRERRRPVTPVHPETPESPAAPLPGLHQG